MTLAEKLVWAAVFAQQWNSDEEGRDHNVLEERVLLYAKNATDAIHALRTTFDYVRKNDDVRKRLNNEVFEHLRDMAFQLED